MNLNLLFYLLLKSLLEVSFNLLSHADSRAPVRRQVKTFAKVYVA